MRIRLKDIFITICSIALLCSCSVVTDDLPDETQKVAASYVNFAITVSNGNPNVTRNTPTGGENGDGREAGFERENTITGITLILYKDDDGINTTANPTLDLIRYFPVTLGNRDTQGTTYTSKTEEAYYTTGNQPLGSHNLDLTATYHAIVIANAPQIAASLTEGTSTLSAVRDLTLDNIYVGSLTGSAANCTNFVMSSEQDNTINFGSVTGTNLDGTTHTKGQDILYDLSGQALVIERMAARIDFWAANSNGYKTNTDNTAYTTPGYEYTVYDNDGITDTGDRFLVTGIVPFNLTNGNTTYGNEYLIKRIRTTIDDASTTSYLADETVTNYVIDPQTLSKASTLTPAITNSLEDVYSSINAGTLESSSYFHSIATMQATSDAKSTISSKDNVIICYPMENTLLPDSKLYYYATGIAIVGYYYTSGSTTGTRYVYLGYLCHQGDATSYDITPSTTALSTTATMGSTTPMKYGIVRNNIYRVSINGIDSKGTLNLNIKVKKWDPFTHEVIYM